MSKKFYVTTPIYYANGLPHLGHANSSFIADFYARWKRLLWYEVKFGTGLDENGQKMVEKAQEEGKSVVERLDYVATESQRIWKELQISYTDFVRTTDADHHHFVQSVLQKIYQADRDQGFPFHLDPSSPLSEQPSIYLWEYQGLYCVGCEAFKNPRDLTPEGTCPDHLTTPQLISEKNWFFNLKKYEAVFEQLWQDIPHFVEPGYRFNEVKAFVRSGLENFSISRENKHTGIGIPLPRDSEQVTYVWFDALLNYLTLCYRQDEAGKFWSEGTEILHVLGKDIVKFHATYWPAMLACAGYRFPDREFVTGYLTVDGQKMSKSLGNVVDPLQVVREYDRDVLVFYLLYDVSIGVDGDFSWNRFQGTWEKMLIWGRGNLVNRVANLGKKYGLQVGRFDSTRFKDFLGQEVDAPFLSRFLMPGGNDSLSLEEFIHLVEEQYLDAARTKNYLEDWYSLVQLANEYIAKAEPWKKYKEESTQQEALDDLSFLLWLIKQLGLLSAPFLVNGFKKLQDILGNQDIAAVDSTAHSLSSDFFASLLLSEFSVDLQPMIMYQRRED